MTRLLPLLWLELKLSLNANHGLIACLFFLAVMLIFSFAIGPDQQLIAQLAPAILWSGVLFASLFGQDKLFTQDSKDGSLDLYRLANVPLTIIVLNKTLVLWLTGLCPLIFITPLLGFILGLTLDTLTPLLLSLLVGTPALALLSTLTASLITRISQGTLLAPMLSLPFAVPIIIFGHAATTPSSNTANELLILLGFTGLLLILTPLIATKALNLSDE